jgi:hypothetical protein
MFNMNVAKVSMVHDSPQDCNHGIHIVQYLSLLEHKNGPTKSAFLFPAQLEL